MAGRRQNGNINKHYFGKTEWTQSDVLDYLADLSVRQRQVFFYKITGHTDKETANKAGISTSSARHHFENALAKAGLYSTDLLKDAFFSILESKDFFKIQNILKEK